MKRKETVGHRRGKIERQREREGERERKRERERGRESALRLCGCSRRWRCADHTGAHSSASSRVSSVPATLRAATAKAVAAMVHKQRRPRVWRNKGGLEPVLLAFHSDTLSLSFYLSYSVSPPSLSLPLPPAEPRPPEPCWPQRAGRRSRAGGQASKLMTRWPSLPPPI